MVPSEEQARAVAAAEGGEEEIDEEEEEEEEDRRGNEKVARKLLKPRRRAQIEVWLAETVSRWETQHCAAGRLFGHFSDLLTPSAAGESRRSTPAGDDGNCPVCGRSAEDRESLAHQPGKDPARPSDGKPSKGKHMLRGIRTAMGQLMAKDGGRGGEKHQENKGWDRAVSTQMFLAEASEHGSSTGTAISSDGPFGGGDSKAPADGRKALEERMARLTRAQKLLDRSQARR